MAGYQSGLLPRAASELQSGSAETGMYCPLEPFPVATQPFHGPKRLADIVLALAGLILLSPLFAVTALVVTWTSPGSVFFRSRRLGLNGSEFFAWKIRSMYIDADERLARLLKQDAALRDEYERYHKLKDDPRITSIGRFLRVLSIDELPQLLNVLKGEMSIVGPRPKLLFEAKVYGSALAEVLAVRPGLTGLWQTSGRNNLDMEQRVLLDLEYVRNRTFLGDIVLIVKTTLQLIRPSRHGAC